MACTACTCIRCGENRPADYDDVCEHCHVAMELEWMHLLGREEAPGALVR
jgi:hypothetical protein